MINDNANLQPEKEVVVLVSYTFEDASSIPYQDINRRVNTIIIDFGQRFNNLFHWCRRHHPADLLLLLKFVLFPFELIITGCFRTGCFRCLRRRKSGKSLLFAVASLVLFLLDFFPGVLISACKCDGSRPSSLSTIILVACPCSSSRIV